LRPRARSGHPAGCIAGKDERAVGISVPGNRLAELKRARALAVSLRADRGRQYRVRENSPAVVPATRTFAVRVLHRESGRVAIDRNKARLLGISSQKARRHRRGHRAVTGVPVPVR
jgi:hypothetical protein